jgi:hypothetical protein
MTSPYIGITDFTTFEQVARMSQVMDRHKPRNSTLKLHVGVMMSYKTLYGIPTKWQSVFPENERVASIFGSKGVYNCLHFADHDNNPDLAGSIFDAISFCGDNVHAVQLDMTWPDPEEISRGVEAAGKPIEIILQIGTAAFGDVCDDPQRLVNQLQKYNGVIHRVLLDKSMGKGVGMDAKSLVPFALAIQKAYPNIGIGAAGGLGPDTTHLAIPLVKAIKNLSIDAQGRLRASGSALDPINWGMAKRYLVKAISLLS